MAKFKLKTRNFLERVVHKIVKYEKKLKKIHKTLDGISAVVKIGSVFGFYAINNILKYREAEMSDMWIITGLY
ncbi:MAG: hypothetical protein JSW66_01990 [Phycisphaerales bacterium]|nr:MAG: hypothetical protein JSW66_01990 [Phycisphaerales bacterium]